MNQNENRRPCGDTDGEETIGRAVGFIMPLATLSRTLDERRASSIRLPWLSCGHVDPYLCRVRPYDGPSTFGLTASELVAEARRCRESGWGQWEIEIRFSRPETAVAA